MTVEKKPLMVDGGQRVGTIATHMAVGRTGRSMMAAALLAQSMQPKTYMIGPRTLSTVYDLHLGAHEVDAEVREAAINLAREVEKRAFQAGLEAAADYLKGTAADYQQGIDRDQNSGRQLTENERRNIRLNKEKVALLKGQAGHVLDLPLR
jgi:hypothetical protein